MELVVPVTTPSLFRFTHPNMEDKMADTRGYERGEDKLVECVAQVLFRRMPPEEARNFAVAVQRLSSDLSGNNQPASSCRRLRERVFQLIGEQEPKQDVVDDWKCENCGAELCYFENCHNCGATCKECLTSRAERRKSGQQNSAQSS